MYFLGARVSQVITTKCTILSSNLSINKISHPGTVFLSFSFSVRYRVGSAVLKIASTVFNVKKYCGTGYTTVLVFATAGTANTRNNQVEMGICLVYL